MWCASYMAKYGILHYIELKSIPHSVRISKLENHLIKYYRVHLAILVIQFYWISPSGNHRTLNFIIYSMLSENGLSKFNF